VKKATAWEDLPAKHPYNVVSGLLHDIEAQQGGGSQPEPILARAIAALERREPEVIRAARDAGVDIVPLGISPLFQSPRFFEGEGTDWVLGPADRHDHAVVPRREGRELKRLQRAGLNPLIYIAHEVDHARTAQLRSGLAGRRVITSADADELVGPAPPPADSVDLAKRLGKQANKFLLGMRRTAEVAGAAALEAVTGPASLIEGAIAAINALDPVVVGAMPAISERPGAPAAWYILTRWDW
jgi:hypothetical protein